MRYLCATAMILTLTTGSAMAQSRTLTADIWADNWFVMYANSVQVIEDSVPITTERSFNSETVAFLADVPTVIAFEFRDFKENDTGLEYIGTDRQQMGDGGAIAQFRDAATGQLVGVTDSAMRCLVVHRAPVDRSCAMEGNPVAGVGACGFEMTEIPAGWTEPGFDDSVWPAAVEHTAAEVGPKEGYDTIDWDPVARLIWSADLVQDNTLLCRMTLGE